ncbi:hypothetical protein CDCA_CDCA17G4306 [Cyanidium caldarium]|uniref:GATA-type domain-containing protein n=1 Tax=Cyanidium caldarium TaxID=2771 RepID=A0AAV9J1N0_CYACA|nr:hypothetical protein CDCA_CDCA17G4306 [Cyanidium caldarium]
MNGKRGLHGCDHCGTHHTPLWRPGPNGPKTLCNACGVKWKKGTLGPDTPVVRPPWSAHHPRHEGKRSMMGARKGTLKRPMVRRVRKVPEGAPAAISWAHRRQAPPSPPSPSRMLVRVDSGAELGAFYRRGASLEESDTDSLASISDVEARAPQGPRKVSAKSPAHDDKGTAALHGMHVICDAVQWMEGAHSPVSTGRSPSLDHARTHSVSALTLTPPHHPYPLAR